MNDYKLVAPDIDSLLNCFERGFLNPSAPSEDLCKAMDPLFEMLRDLAPLRKTTKPRRYGSQFQEALLKTLAPMRTCLSGAM